MEKNIVFISGYSDENIFLGQEFLQTSSSIVGLWANSLLDRSQLDFMSILNIYSNEDFYKEAMLIPTSPNQQEFLEDIYSVIKRPGFSPDIIMIRGETTDVWPIVALKEKCGIDAFLVLILDRLTFPLRELDRKIIESFDLVFEMGPSCSAISQILPDMKTVKIFEKYESFLFRDMTPYLTEERKESDCVLILTGTENHKEIREKYGKKENISIIDVEACPQEDLVIYLNAAKTLIDETGDENFNLILKKMGLKSFSLKGLEDKDFNPKRDSFEDVNIRINNLKEFSEAIKNKIISVIKDEDLSKKSLIDGQDIKV